MNSLAFVLLLSHYMYNICYNDQDISVQILVREQSRIVIKVIWIRRFSRNNDTDRAITFFILILGLATHGNSSSL